MFKKFADAAKSLKEKADIGAKLEGAKQFASNKLETTKADASAAWEKHWPTIENVLIEGLLSIAEEKLKDDAILEAAFGKLYEALPLAVRLALSRDQFISFSMLQRGPVLMKLQDVRAQRRTIEPPGNH